MTKEKLEKLNELDDRIKTIESIVTGFRNPHHDFDGNLNVIDSSRVGRECYNKWKRTQTEFWSRELKELRQEFENL